jgi:hypothetical protein
MRSVKLLQAEVGGGRDDELDKDYDLSNVRRVFFKICIPCSFITNINLLKRLF